DERRTRHADVGPVHDVQGVPARRLVRHRLCLQPVRLRYRAGHQAGAQGLCAGRAAGQLRVALICGRQEGQLYARWPDLALDDPEASLLADRARARVTRMADTSGSRPWRLRIPYRFLSLLVSVALVAGGLA